MCVCVFAMHAQTNGRIWTKLGMKDPYPQGHNLGGSKLGADPRGRSPQGKTPFLHYKLHIFGLTNATWMLDTPLWAPLEWERPSGILRNPPESTMGEQM